MHEVKSSPIKPVTPLNSVLLLSVRSSRLQAANGVFYEFEDLITTLCDTTLCCPANEMSAHRKCYRIARYAGLSDRVADGISSMGKLNVLEDHHDIILLVLDNPWQMHLINQVKGWRDHPAKKVCYITECWPKELTNWRLLKEPFTNFDHIFLSIAATVPVLANETGIPCSYLPCGVNTTTFVQDGLPADRVIDLSYIGRREPALHEQLKLFTEKEKLFYLFDTARSQKLLVDDPVEHRKMFASILRRTGMSIALPAKSNSVDETGGIDEISARYFEFAAAGIVIVGRAPDCDAFRRLFDWPDAVVNLGHDYRSIAEVISPLLGEHEWMQALSKRNIVNSLRKNDWVYRLIDIAQSVGFAPNNRMNQRLEELELLSKQVESS